MISYKKWVRLRVEDACDYLRLYEWRIGIAFDEEDDDDGSLNTVAYINVNSDYFKATISFLPFAERLFKNKEYETLMQCIVHEVCHIWTDPMLQFARKSASPLTTEYVTTAHEQLTQRIALLALRGIPERSYLPLDGIYNSFAADDHVCVQLRALRTANAIVGRPCFP